MSTWCDVDTLNIKISIAEWFGYCGTNISDLVFYFNISDIEEIEVSFTANDNSHYDGFMIEFNFEIFAFTESAYTATRNLMYLEA